jgi:long-chain acyl-CoA synthetase
MRHTARMTTPKTHTIAQLVADAEQRLGTRVVSYVPRGPGGSFVPVRADENAAARQELSAALLARGVRPGDRVAIVAETRLEWALCDLAILSIGAVTVGVYPTSTPEQMRYIVEHAGASIAFVASGPRLAIEKSGVALKEIVDLDDLATFRGEGRRALASHANLADELVMCRDSVRPKDVAAIVYTSGTTGQPKGVVLTHLALYTASKVGVEALQLTDADVGVGFLPLAHALARVNYYGTLHAGTVTWFSRTMEEVADVWRVAHPTVLGLVPRVLDKIHARVLSAVAESPAPRQKLFARALEVGKEYARLVAEGARIPTRLAMEHALWERLVYKRVRAGIGWDRLRFALCGGAPLRREVAEFFGAIGVTILEGYGLSETSAATVLSLPNARRAGSVGRPLAGVEVKIAADGEILLKCPGLFARYEKDEDATRAAIDADGFFATGDVGHVDADGFVFITDRKKDLIVTAGGKNVAPQAIEAALAADPRVLHAVAIGDQRPYLVALLFVDPIVGDRAARERVANEAVARANQGLARFEQIKTCALLDDEPTIASGLLTPTQKVKRRAVAERYAAMVEALYATPREQPSA